MKNLILVNSDADGLTLFKNTKYLNGSNVNYNNLEDENIIVADNLIPDDGYNCLLHSDHSDEVYIDPVKLDEFLDNLSDDSPSENEILDLLNKFNESGKEYNFFMMDVD